MKTTIDISDVLFREVRALAHARKTTVKSLVEDGLQIILQREATAQTAQEWNPPTFAGSGFVEGVDENTWAQRWRESEDAALRSARLQ